MEINAPHGKALPIYLSLVFFLIVGLFVLRIHLLEGSLGLLIYYNTICVHERRVVQEW